MGSAGEDVSGARGAVPRAQVRAFAARYLEALRAGDARAATEVAGEAAASGMGVAAVHVHIVQPAMKEIGSLWARDALTIMEEHLATSISEEVLAGLFSSVLKRPLASRERVLLAGAEGEEHLVGLRMVADVLEGAGFDVVCAGVGLSARELVQRCRELRPQVVGLSASTLRYVPALLGELDDLWALDEPPRLMAGGAAAATLIDAGLDVAVVPSAEHAVAVVDRLLRGPPRGPPVSPELRRRFSRDAPEASGGATIIGSPVSWKVDTTGARRDSARAGRFLADRATISNDETRRAARAAFRMRQRSSDGG